VYSEPSLFEGMPTGMIVFITLFIAVFVIVIATAVIRGLSTWSANNAAPQMTAAAVIVSKRTEVWGGSGDTSASTNYYATFELADRSRVELGVPAKTFGLLAEGDQGQLTFQGTRFKHFERELL